MSLYNSFDRNAHFDELNTPLSSQGEGVLSPSTRKIRAAKNLGLSLDPSVGGAEVFRGMPAPATATDTATLTVTQLINGVIQGTPTAAANYTLPTVAALEAVLTDFEVNDAFQFTIINRAATATFDITIVTNTGWTLNGPLTVGAGASANGDGAEWTAGTFRARKTAAGAWTLYRVA